MLSLLHKVYIFDSANVKAEHTEHTQHQTNEGEKWTIPHPGSLLWVWAALLFS